MKKTLLVIATLALVGVGAWYFIQKTGSSTRLSKFVPAESDIVVNLDLVALFKKADLANAEKRVFIQSLVKKHADSACQKVLGQLLKDPASSGVRFSEQAFFFFRNTYDDLNNNAGLLLGIKNAADFEAMLRKIDPNLSIQKEGDFFCWLMPAGSVLAWDSKTALIYKGRDVNADMVNAMNILSRENPSIHQKKLFKEAYIKGHDIHVYLDYSKLLLQSPQAGEFLKLEGGMSYGAGISFVNGEITMENKVAFENSKDARWMDLYHQKAEGHSLAYTVNEVPLGAIQIQLNTEKLFEILMENPSTKEGLEEMAAELEVKPEEIMEMFTGTLSLGFSGVETKIEKRNFFGMEKEQEVTLPKGALFLGIKNQELFKKVLDKSGQKPENGKYELDIPFVGMFYLVKTEAGISIMVLESMADQLAANKTFGDVEYGEPGKYLKAHANAGYINLDLQSMSPSFTNFIKKEFPNYSLIETTLKPLDHLEFRQDKKRGISRMVFKNKEKNSLMELLDLADAVYLEYQKIEAEKEVEVEEEQMMEEMEVSPNEIQTE